MARASRAAGIEHSPWRGPALGALGAWSQIPPQPRGLSGRWGASPAPPSQAGVAVPQRPWHHTLPWGPHSKRIFLGQLRYGLSRFHLPNYET